MSPPKQIEIRFSVPGGLLEDLRDIAESEGSAVASVHRLVWIKGLASYIKENSDRLLNRQLRRNVSTEDPCFLQAESMTQTP